MWEKSETEQERLLRKPIKSNGETVALMSANGLLLWDKRRKVWEVFKMEDLVKMHEELVKASGLGIQKKETTER